MALDIFAIAKKLNELAVTHPVGELQKVRTAVKGLKRQPGSKLFTDKTTFKDWAFHHGGRTELQFNIGHAGGGDLRYGVAFSFQLNMTLKSIDILVPKVKLFNDFIGTNADGFSDMRMWHYRDSLRSIDSVPGEIASALVSEGIFVFLGNRQSAVDIDYEAILVDFDRLLPLYRYVESGGASPPVPVPKGGFVFKAGYSIKATTAKATLAEKELDQNLRHNILQGALYRRLAAEYGVDNVRTEQPSGVGTLIDAVVHTNNEYWFYEIKTALTPRACLRDAIGQLLEYSFWPGAQEPTRFIVLGETPLDKDGEEYLRRLIERFSLPIEYDVITA